MVCGHPNIAWSHLNARPDCVVHNTTAKQPHELFELKIVSPIPTGRAPLPTLGATFAFANTEPRLLSFIVGSPPTFQQAKYQDALRRGHVVTPLILELFGGFARHARHLIHRLALARDSRFLPDPVAAVSGTPSCSAFHTQFTSIALHSAVATQIAVYADYVVPSSR
eukprot:5482161-Pleurochrysis_carterae.AAC.2